MFKAIAIAAIAAIAALSACSVEHYEPGFIGSTEAEYVGNPTNPNPLTFWWYAGDGAILRPALETALGRIRDATCLPVDVSFDAHHWVRQYAPDSFPNGWNGWTVSGGGAPWSNTRIRISSAAEEAQASRIIVHEIAEHVLRRSNGHATSANGALLNETLLESICSVQDCECFHPETQL